MLRFPTQLIAAACLVASALCVSAEDFPAPLRTLELNDGDCVVFLGDSITHQRLYTQYVEDFFYTRFPNKRIRFHNAGVGGAKAWDALQRFDRDVAAYKPKYVTILLGMNDGAYQPFNQKIFDTYMQDMNEVVEKIKDIGATPILMTPTMLDARAARMKGKDTESQEFYNSTLAYYGTWLRDVAQRKGYGFVDMWSPLNNITINERETNPTFTLIEDAVHPGPSGQLIMAYAILDDLGLKGPLSTIKINVSRKPPMVTREQGGALEDVQVTDSGVTFNWKADALPFVVPDQAAEGAKLLHLSHRASREALNVFGLPGGTYQLLIDDEPVGEYTATRLADGIELQHNAKTPQHRQAAKVAELNKTRNDGPIGDLRNEWRKFQQYARLKRQVAEQPDNAKAAEQLNKAEAAIEGMEQRVQKAEAEAKAIEDEIFKVNKPEQHRYELKRIDRRAANTQPSTAVAVSGIVTLNGMPLQGATITFSSGDRPVASGTTDERGQFQMEHDGEKGVRAGEYSVSVTGNAVPEAYAAPGKSALTVHVVEDGPNVFNFELKN